MTGRPNDVCGICDSKRNKMEFKLRYYIIIITYYIEYLFIYVWNQWAAYLSHIRNVYEEFYLCV